jgi:hypothetical protein
MTYSALAIPRLTSSDTSASAMSQTSTAVNILTNCAAPLKGLSAAHMATLRPAKAKNLSTGVMGVFAGLSFRSSCRDRECQPHIPRVGPALRDQNTVD